MQTLSSLPPRAGVGLKADHCRTVIETSPDIGFFEVHAENYMGAGGPPHRYLHAVRERYPLSVHGVGLSIGGMESPDREHLRRIRRLLDIYEPAAFSEHLAWSVHDARFFNDLLPVPYDAGSLARVIRHVDEVQEAIGRRMLLENPSSYIEFEGSTYGEARFIAEVAARTGCGLLLDINNVFVSCTNHGWSAERYLQDYPLHLVEEIHLAGHAPERDDMGRELLIDAHDREACDAVWSLFADVIRKTGPLPTLIEWDNRVPAWPRLAAEAERAGRVMQMCLAAEEVTHDLAA